jgi:hypothetical protein
VIADSLAVISFCLRHWKVIAFLLVVQIGCNALRSQGDVRLYSSGPGVVYSYAELVGALEAAGVPPAAAPVGAAIARAESGGRSDAVHLCPTNCVPGQAPEQSYGPWQINVLAHPDVSPACAMELGCAARAAARISNYGRNWNAWSTYNSGAFGSYLVA